MVQLRQTLDAMVTGVAAGEHEQLEILEAFRMFANSRGWMRRIEIDIDQGLSAEAAVEKEQSTARARMAQQNWRQRRGIAPQQFPTMPRAALNAEDEPLCFM